MTQINLSNFRPLLWRLAPSGILCGAANLAAVQWGTIAFFVIFFPGMFMWLNAVAYDSLCQFRQDRLYQRTAQLEREAGLHFGKEGLLREAALPSGGYVGLDDHLHQRVVIQNEGSIHELNHDEEVLQATQLALRGCHHVWGVVDGTCVKCGAHSYSLVAATPSFVNEPYPIEMVHPRYMLPRKCPHVHQWQLGHCRVCGARRYEVYGARRHEV